MERTTSSHFFLKLNLPGFHLAWRRIAGGAILMAILACGMLEAGARFIGNVPSVVDDKDLWSYWREQAQGADQSTLVLLGNSRMQVDFNIEAWQKIFPRHKVIQLSIDASSPFPVLEDLARDESFRGVILCNLDYIDLKSFDNPKALEYVAHYHQRWNFIRRVQRLAKTYVQTRLVFLGDGRFPRRWIPTVLKGAAPKPNFVQVSADRSKRINFSRIEDLEALRKHFEDNIGAPSPDFAESWEKPGAAKLEQLVQIITKRGGRVLFVKHITTGGLYEKYETFYPSSQTWDPLMRRLSAFSLNCKTLPGVSRFICPDGSHLDYRDTEAYTTLIARAMLVRGIFQASRAG